MVDARYQTRYTRQICANDMKRALPEFIMHSTRRPYAHQATASKQISCGQRSLFPTSIAA